MGLIRKTLSISTLGLVGWKSKKELLAETEAELEQTRTGLGTTQAELEEARQRRLALEEALEQTRAQLTAAELQTLRDVGRARRRGQWEQRLRKRKGSVARAKKLAQPIIRSTIEAGERAGERVVTDAEPVVQDARTRGRAARARAEKQATELRERAGKRATELRKPRTRTRRLRRRARRRAEELRSRVPGPTTSRRVRLRRARRRATTTARDRADAVAAKVGELGDAAGDISTTAREHAGDIVDR